MCYASHASEVRANYADGRAASRSYYRLHDLKVTALIDQLILVSMASQCAKVCVSHTDLGSSRLVDAATFVEIGHKLVSDWQLAKSCYFYYAVTCLKLTL